MLIGFGQLMHRFEWRLNRTIVQSDSPSKLLKKDKSDEVCKPLKTDAAFNKGAEYFSELFFFYGILLSLAIYEMNKAYISSIKSSNRHKEIHKDIKNS